jgi:hypothetical protein
VKIIIRFLLNSGFVFFNALAEVVWRLGYRLDNKRITVKFLTGEFFFSLLRRIQAGSGAHPTSYSVDIEGSLSRHRAAGACSY